LVNPEVVSGAHPGFNGIWGFPCGGFEGFFQGRSLKTEIFFPRESFFFNRRGFGENFPFFKGGGRLQAKGCTYNLFNKKKWGGGHERGFIKTIAPHSSFHTQTYLLC